MTDFPSWLDLCIKMRAGALEPANLYHAMIEAKILLLLFIANGAPIILHNLLGNLFGQPVDSGMVWPDGKPLLGPTKTWRGIAGAVLSSSAAAWVLNLGVSAGLAVGALAMLGDLLSSLLKRRFGILPSGMALGLDQIPESLLPLLWLKAELHLGSGDVLRLTIAFFVLELAISRVLYWLGIRKQPY